MTTYAVFEMLRRLSMTAFCPCEKPGNCKFQCLRLLKSYACLRNKECYECRKLEHRELLESYEEMFQIRVFAPLGRVSILQTEIISQIKHIATSQNTLQHISMRGVQEDICVLILVHVLQIGGGCAPPNPPAIS